MTAASTMEPVCKKPRISIGVLDDNVKVDVGPEKKSFNMHKTLLCNVAPYFKAALEGGFMEASTGVLELPEDDATTFERFQLWVYTNSFLEEGQSDKDISWDALVDLWIFGEARGIADLQNACIDALIAKSVAEAQTPVNHICQIYNNTSENSPLRRLVVDLSAHKGNLDEWFHGSNEHYHKDFLIDLAVQLYLSRKSQSRIQDFNRVRSNYYVKPATSTSDTSGSNPK